MLRLPEAGIEQKAQQGSSSAGTALMRCYQEHAADCRRTRASSRCSGDALSGHDRILPPLSQSSASAAGSPAASPAAARPGRSDSATCRSSSAGEWHGNSGRRSAISASTQPRDHTSDAWLHRCPVAACTARSDAGLALDDRNLAAKDTCSTVICKSATWVIHEAAKGLSIETGLAQGENGVQAQILPS